ncbi:MAG: hypothetical protein ACHQ6T_00280 [Myxococcota bacterium]
MAPKAKYPHFRRIDGTHPWKRRVAGGFVDYSARRRRDGQVAFFNFALAKEMGLVPAAHPERLNPELSRAILSTFGLQILNEWDYLHRTRVPARDRLPHTYMATRYLQLQHPDRRGTTSGDGRSVWNGSITHAGVTWDVSSCGVGVTRLCPATAREGRFFRTGSRTASYGCGTAALAEGISSALMSETFHRNGIATERVLAVIALGNGYAINVRAGRNLLRPSHFFAPLKQGDLPRLRAAIDVFAERQIANGDWPKLAPGAARYRFLADECARGFARAAATFESEYVFCWLDWDGDNVLASGGIVDYGSVRQFGLYHREYRFDDAERWSTTIPEQRMKARYIAQCFAQIRACLLEGRKRPLEDFARDACLRIFDREFAATKERLLVRKLGLRRGTAEFLLRARSRELERFRHAFAYFERARCARGPCKVPDGLTWNAVFSMRDLLRELPERYSHSLRPVSPRELLEIGLSSYASRADRRATPGRRRMAGRFQASYLALLRAAAAHERRPLAELVREVARRSAIVNRRDRITGDGIDYATDRLIRYRRRLSSGKLHRVIAAFVDHQDLNPREPASDREPPDRQPAHDVRRVLDRLIAAVAEMRHGL